MPVYLLIIEICAFRTSWRAVWNDRRLSVFLVTFIILPLVAAFVLLVLNFDSLVDYSMRNFTLKERLLTQVHVIFFYLRLLMFPRISNMSLFHDDFPLTTQFDALTAILLFVLVGMLLLAWNLRKTFSVVSFGIFLFFGAHLLESTVFALELVFEHRNYLAGAGLLLLPVYALFKVESHRALPLLSAVFVLTFAFMTATRAAEWGDRDVFHQVSVIEHPGSPRALNNFVNYLMSIGRHTDSIANLEKLITLTPDDIGPYLHLQVAKCINGEPDLGALARAAEMARQNPMLVYGHSALQALTVNVVEGKCKGVTVDAIEPVVTAAFSYAEQNKVFDNLDNLYRMRAIIALNRGRYAAGYSDFRIAHEMTGKIEILHELIQYQIRIGQLSDAAETLELMEQQNEQRKGIDTYVIDQAREMLAKGRQSDR